MGIILDYLQKCMQLYANALKKKPYYRAFTVHCNSYIQTLVIWGGGGHW